MKILASFVTTNFEGMRARWHGMPDRAAVAGVTGTSIDSTRRGVLAIVDLDSGVCEWELPLDSPSGFAIVHDTRQIFVSSMIGNHVSVVDRTLAVTDSFGSRMMNDLHNITSNGHDELVVASSGTDAILTFTRAGQPTWQWCAHEHGYRDTPAGTRCKLDAKVDYRPVVIGTPSQATHLNSAWPAVIDGRESLLATLFHQGSLILIDRASGRLRELVTGMNRPHNIRPALKGGWLVCSSGHSLVVRLNDRFEIDTILDHQFAWTQDAIEVDDQLIVADANDHRIVRFDRHTHTMRDAITYSSNWKIYQIESLRAPASKWLLDAALA